MEEPCLVEKRRTKPGYSTQSCVRALAVSRAKVAWYVQNISCVSRTARRKKEEKEIHVGEQRYKKLGELSGGVFPPMGGGGVGGKRGG